MTKVFIRCVVDTHRCIETPDGPIGLGVATRFRRCLDPSVVERNQSGGAVFARGDRFLAARRDKAHRYEHPTNTAEEAETPFATPLPFVETSRLHRLRWHWFSDMQQRDPSWLDGWQRSCCVGQDAVRASRPK